MQILTLRARVPNSGTANAIIMHQIHAILSSSGNVTTNCLFRAEKLNRIYYYTFLLNTWDSSLI